VLLFELGAAAEAVGGAEVGPGWLGAGELTGVVSDVVDTVRAPGVGGLVTPSSSTVTGELAVMVPLTKQVTVRFAVFAPFVQSPTSRPFRSSTLVVVRLWLLTTVPGGNVIVI
jgi:hypothetical protein